MPEKTLPDPGAIRSLPSHKQAWELCRSAFNVWVDDQAQSMGAALAYYTLFSIAPLLLIVISVAGIWFGPEAARDEIFGQISGLIGVAGASAIQSRRKPYVLGWEPVLSVVNEVSAFTMVMTMFAMIYKLMPHSHIEWRDVGVGAFATQKWSPKPRQHSPPSVKACSEKHWAYRPLKRLPSPLTSSAGDVRYKSMNERTGQIRQTSPTRSRARALCKAGVQQCSIEL